MTGTLTLPIGWADAPGGRRASRLVGLSAAVALFVLCVGQAWALPRMLDGRTEPVVSRSADAAPAPSGGPTLDADAAVERATHQLTRVAGGLEVADPSYRARFDASGFAYTPAGSSGRFGLSLASVQRGIDAIPIDRRAWAGESNAAERPVARGVTERVTAGDGELEWDVVLASRPSGSGALTVGARLDGVTGTPTQVRNASGPAWRLALQGGGTVHLDELVVRDAHGAEVHRALPTVTATGVSLTVPDRVLATAAYPLVLDPTVSGPTTASGPVSSKASVAFDGTDHLVVWQQFVETREGGDVYRIYGVRMKGSDGSRIGTPFLISSTDPETNGNADTRPDVAWNGASFLVVWEHRLFFGPSLIQMRRVSGTGTPIGAVRYLPTSFGLRPAVAAEDNSDCAGSCPLSEWLVVWNGGGFAAGRLVYSDGTPLGTSPLTLGAREINVQEVDVAANTTGYLVTSASYVSGDVGSESGVVRFQKVNKDGSLGVAEVLEQSTDYYPRVASDGWGFLVVFRRQTADGGDIYGVTLQRWGYIVRQPFPITTAFGNQTLPAVASSGGAYLATWQGVGNASSDVFAARLAGNGDVLDPNGFGVATIGNVMEIDPAVAPAAGGGWVVDYQYGTSGPVLQRTVAPK